MNSDVYVFYMLLHDLMIVLGAQNSRNTQELIYLNMKCIILSHMKLL